MATETLTFEYTAGSNIYIRVFDTGGLVFDFSDDSFKSLASATTPYLAATERADMGGTGLSGYTADLDLDRVNDTPAIKRYTVKAYNNATPADADNPVSDPLSVTIQLGQLEVGDVVCQGEVSVKSTAGDTAQVSAWLERAGVKIPVSSIAGVVFTADDTTDVITSNAHGLNNDDRILLTTDGTLPGGLNGTTAYFVISSTTNTFKVSLTSGGSAVDITSTGSGTHKWHQPTVSVEVREHGSGTGLAAFPATGTVGDLNNDIFEVEVSTPAFTDDRQFEVEITIIVGGVAYKSSNINVVVG